MSSHVSQASSNEDCYIINKNYLNEVQGKYFGKTYPRRRYGKKHVLTELNTRLRDGLTDVCLVAQQALFQSLNKKQHLLTYKRNHPMYGNWIDWTDIVHLYYSKSVSKTTMDLLNFARTGPLDVLTENDIEFSIEKEFLPYTIGIWIKRFLTTFQKYHNTNLTVPSVLSMWEELSKVEIQNTRESLPEGVQYIQGKFALLAKITLYIMAFRQNIFKTDMNNEEKQYFVDLLRTCHAMRWNAHRTFDLDLILSWQKYYKRKQPLLYTLYHLSYTDHITAHSMALVFERLKHYKIAQEQGGSANQCPSAFSEEFWNTCERLISSQEQGIGIEHNVNIKSEDWQKLRGMLELQRHEFLEGFDKVMRRTIIGATSMFLIASVMACIMRYGLDASYAVLTNILNLLYKLITNDNSDRHVAKEQGGGFTIPFLPAFFINNVVSPPAKLLKRLWSSSSVDTTMRRIGFIGDLKVERGLDRITNWIKKMFNDVYAWYLYQVHGIVAPQDLDSESHACKVWYEELDEFLESYYKGDMFWNETTWSCVYNLYARGLTLARSPIYKRQHQQLWKSIHQLSNVLEQFKSHNKDGNTIRNPPVTIYLSGGTGTGKSSVTYPLAAEILQDIFKDEPCPVNLAEKWKSLIYMRSSEQEFWDGYENQLITVFDDFSQRTDASANPNLELFEIIRASNCFPYPLHMAALEQKASTQFTSKVIIVSSNQERPKTASLNFPDALYRRFDVCVRVKRDVKQKTTRFDPGQYSFTLYNMETGKDIRQISYRELVSLCTQHYRDRRDYVSSIEEYITDCMKAQQVATEQGWFDNTHWLTGSRSTTLDAETFMEQQSDNVINKELESRESGNEEYHFQGIGFDEDEYEQKQNAMHCLRTCVAEAKAQFGQMESWWNVFKKEHPYLVAASQAICYLGMAIMFLKMFKMMWDGTKHVIQGYRKPKNDKLSSLPFNDDKAVKQEMYAPSAPVVKQESYSAQPPVVRQEAYQPLTPVVKQEGLAQIPLNYFNIGGYTRNPLPGEPPGEYYTHTTPMGPQRTMAPPGFTWSALGTLVALPPTPSEQGVKDLNTSEIIHSSIRKNLYKIYHYETGDVYGHVLFIRGRVCLFPKHFQRSLNTTLSRNPTATLSFESCMLRRAFDVKLSEFMTTLKPFESPEEIDVPVITRDLVACYVPTAMIHPDISNQFVPRRSLQLCAKTRVAMPVLAKGAMGEADQHLVIRYRNAMGSLTLKESLPVGNNVKTVARFVRDAWCYDADTEVSECGAPLIVRNTAISPGKICGIHVAGIPGEGYSTPFYREDVDKVLAMFPAEQKIAIEQSLDLVQSFEPTLIPKEAEMVRLGKLRKPVVQPLRTKIQPSLVYGRVQKPKTKPCLLRPQQVNGQMFDPRAYRLGRLGNVPNAISRDIIVNAENGFVDELSQVFMDKRESVFDENLKPEYTLEETIKGIDGDEFVNSVKRNTSPGYPWIQMSGCEDRHKFFGTEDEYRLEGPQFRLLEKRVSEIIQKAKEGICVENVFVDTLKDERKPIAKAHKTRLFSAGPMCYYIACKKYFNGIVALIQRARDRSHVSVGTNVYSEDWNRIAVSLLRKSGHMIAGDFEGFDASQHQVLLMSAGRVLIRLSQQFLGTNREQAMIMETLLNSLINSIHINHDDVVQWTHSLPSGHYLTAIINSIFVNLAFCCVYQLAFNKVNSIFARQFWTRCGIVAYGDDHIVSVPVEMLGTFDQLTLPALFQRIGLSYTMEDKDRGAEFPSRKLTEISYLKRTFMFDYDRMRWIAPLTLDTVLETPMWIHQTPDRMSATADNIDWSLRELSLHPAAVWTEFAPNLVALCAECGRCTLYSQHLETRSAVLDE